LPRRRHRRDGCAQRALRRRRRCRRCAGRRPGHSSAPIVEVGAALAAARGLQCVQDANLPGELRRCVYAASAGAPPALRVVIDAWGDPIWFDDDGRVVIPDAGR